MRPRSGTGIRATKKPVIVIAGEDRNDRACLRTALETLCPDFQGRTVEIDSPVRLRQASPQVLKTRIDDLARRVRARALREKADLAGVFIHEDLDATDGDEYLTIHRRVQQAATSCLGACYYALAVEEVEAWLLLFPDALTATVSTWRIPASLRNRDTGMLHDPKKVLMTQVSTSGRRYRESDAPIVFRKAAELGLLSKPVGTNRSWTRLRDDITEFCAAHLRK